MTVVVGVMTARRRVWTNFADHCVLKPAPPAPVGLVIHSLSCMSSAMRIAFGAMPRDLRVDLLHQAPAVRDVAAGIVVPAVPVADEGGHVPAQAVGAAQSIQRMALSRMYRRTSARP